MPSLLQQGPLAGSTPNFNAYQPSTGLLPALAAAKQAEDEKKRKEEEARRMAALDVPKPISSSLSTPKVQPLKPLSFAGGTSTLPPSILEKPQQSLLTKAPSVLTRPQSAPPVSLPSTVSQAGGLLKSLAKTKIPTIDDIPARLPMTQQAVSGFQKARDFVLPRPESDEAARAQGLVPFRGISGRSDPIYLDAFGAVGSMKNVGFNASKYVAEQIAKREAARGTQGLLERGKGFLANVKSKLVDFSSPIEDTLNAVTKKSGIKLLPEQDIKNQIDRALRAPTLAGQFVKDNKLDEVIRHVDDLGNLDQYLIAKHAIELDTRGITTGRNLANDQALVNEFSPRYEQYAKPIANYSQRLLDYSVETGLVSRELADTLKARYPDYVPFQRVFDEVQTQGHGGGIASLGRQTAVQKILGSEREIESPIESLLAKTNDVFKQGEKNLAGKMLAGYESLPDNPFQLQEIKAFVDEKTGRRLFVEGDNAKDTVSFFDDGIKRMFRTTPEVAAAAKSLNVQQLNILGKIFALPTRLARLGITGINIPFIASNIAKDQVTAFINSNHALRSSIANPAVFLKALTAAVGHGKLYDDWIRAGGGGTSFDLAREQVEHTVASIRSRRGIGSRIAYMVRHPSELLRAVENIVGRSEELTRLQQFYGAKQGLLAQTFNEKNATIGAAAASRENTVNFARRGEWGTVLNSAFLYLNASIQGTRTLLRNLRTKPIQTSTKIALTGMFPVATATVWNLSDPERKAAYEDIAEYEKENNLIIIPPNPTKDEQGRWNVIKIPLSQEINDIVGMARRPLEQMYGLDPVAFGDIAKALLGTVSPIEPTKGSVLSTLTPQAVKPTLEAATNRNLFTGFPQVNQSLSRLSPELQVKDYTSGTARQIAAKLNVSPIKVEEFIKGTFGGVGSQALNAVDNALAAMGVIPKDQIGGQKILDAVAARFNKARGGEIENKAFEEEARIEQLHNDEIARAKAQIKNEGDLQMVGETLYFMSNGEIINRKLNSTDDVEAMVKKLTIQSKIEGDTGYRDNAKKIYDQVQTLKGDKGVTKAEKAAQQAYINSLSDEDYDAYTGYKEFQTTYKSTNTSKVRDLLSPDPSKAVEYLRSLPEEEKSRILNDVLTDEEYDKLKAAADTISYAPSSTAAGEGDKVIGVSKEKDKTLMDKIKRLLTPMGGQKAALIKNLTDEVKAGFPFEDIARGEFRDTRFVPVEYTKTESGESLGGEFYNRNDKYKDPTIKLNEKYLVEDWDKAYMVVSHEILHRLFDLSPMGLEPGKDDTNVYGFAEAWLDTWENTKEKYPILQEIDDHLEKRGYDTRDNYVVATERFAYLGANAMNGGIDAIPPELRKYYIGVIKGATAKGGRR